MYPHVSCENIGWIGWLLPCDDEDSLESHRERAFMANLSAAQRKALKTFNYLHVLTKKSDQGSQPPLVVSGYLLTSWKTGISRIQRNFGFPEDCPQA
jgi:hypothetical protein